MALTKENLQKFDAVIIATEHDNVNYQLVAEHSSLIIDTRNVGAARGLKTANTVGD